MRLFVLLLFVTTASLSQTVTRVYFVNKAGAQIHSPIVNGEYLTMREFPVEGFNIHADVTPRPYKVVFQYDALPSRTESGAPYALWGDNIVKPAVIGTHTINITPYINSTTPGARTRLTFNIVAGRPQIIALLSPDRWIAVVGDTITLGVSFFDTADITRKVDTIKSVRLLIDDSGPSVLFSAKPYWYNWKTTTPGMHVVWGSGLDMFGQTFTVPRETLYVVPKAMVDSALFIKRTSGRIEAIITGK